MKRAILVLAFVLFVPILLHADEAQDQADAARDKAEDAYFRGYYLEFGKRDLKAARKAYQVFIWDFEETRDLWLRAHLGLVRIAARIGGGEPDENLAEVVRGLVDPTNGLTPEVKAALEAELRAARRILSRAADPDPVADRIRTWLPALALGPGDSRCIEAEDALVTFGTKAVSALMEALHSSDPIAVGGATRVLLKLRGSEPIRVLIEAIRDMDVDFPVQITLQLRDCQVRHLPIFTAAFEHPLPEVRQAAVTVASRWLNENSMDAPLLWDHILEATEDADPSVQLMAIAAIDGNAGTARRLKVAAAGAQSNDPQIRATAILALFGWPLNEEEITEEMYDSVLALLDCRVVRAEILATSLSLSVGGKLAKLAVLQMLRSGRPLATLRAAEAVQEDRVEVNEDVVRALVRSATIAYSGERDEPWKLTYDAMLSALTAHPAEVRRAGLSTFLPLLSSVNGSPAGIRREYAMNRLLTLLMACTEKEETSDLLVEAYQTLTRDSDRATWLKAFGDRMGPIVRNIAIEVMDSENDDLRLQAVTVLAKGTPVDRRARVLNRFLKDPDPRIRYTVLDTLASLMSREKLAEAARAGILDEDELVRRSSVAPLVRALGTDALPLLLEGVEADPSLTTLAVQAVKDHLTAEDTQGFVKLILEGVPEESDQAVILAAAGSALSDEMILDALRTKNPEMIRWIARFAGDRYLLEAWPLLLPFREREMQAASALVRIRAYHLGLKEYKSVRGSESGDVLIKATEMATSEDPAHRRAAAYALGALKNPAGISLLLDLVKDEDELVQKAAMAALERLGSGEGE